MKHNNSYPIPYDAIREICSSLVNKDTVFFSSASLPDNLSTTEKNILNTIKSISSIYIQIEKDKTEFIPMVQYKTGSSFSMQQIGSEEEYLLSIIDFDRIPLFLACHLSDILYEHSKNIQIGQNTINLYLAATNKENRVSNLINFFYRCMQICRQIPNKKTNRRLILEKAIKISFEPARKNIIKIKLWQLLFEFSYGNVSIIINHIKSLIRITCEEEKELAYDLLLLYLKKHDKTNYEKTINEYSDYLVSKAQNLNKSNPDSPYQSIHMLEKAYDLLDKKSEKRNGIILMIQENSSHAYDHLGNLNVNLSDSINEFRQAFLADIEGKDFRTCLHIILSCAKIIGNNELRKIVIKQKEQAPISSMCPIIVIDDMGLKRAKIPGIELSATEDTIPKERLEFELSRHQEYQGLLIGVCLSIIQSKFQFSINDVEYIVKNNPIIPSDRESIFLQGIFNFLTGNYYIALHILIPQIENLFRNILIQSQIPSFYRDSEHKVYRYYNLTEMLERNLLKQIMDEDFLFNLSCMFTRKEGSNYRNLLAHGLLTEHDANSPSSIFILSFLTRFILAQTIDNRPK